MTYLGPTGSRRAHPALAAGILALCMLNPGIVVGGEQREDPGASDQTEEPSGMVIGHRYLPRRRAAEAPEMPDWHTCVPGLATGDSACRNICEERYGSDDAEFTLCNSGCDAARASIAGPLFPQAAAKTDTYMASFTDEIGNYCGKFEFYAKGLWDQEASLLSARGREQGLDPKGLTSLTKGFTSLWDYLRRGR